MQILDSGGLIAPSSRSHKAYSFWRPTSVAEAVDTIKAASVPPVIFAGGTDLCARFNEGLAPGAMVSLDRVNDLKTIEIEADRIVIGSMVTHAQGAADALVRQHLPGFAEAWGMAANIRVRYWATIGGNLMARRERYELSMMMIALRARLHFVGPAGAFDVAAEDLWMASLDPQSLLLRISFDCASTRFRYDRSLRPVMTLALAMREGSDSTATVATEWLRPLALPIRADLAPREAAEEAFSAIPDSFADPATSNWYLRAAGTTLLRRMLEGEYGR